MFETYRHIIHKYPKISLYQERRLIKQAQGRSRAKKNELVERHIRSVIFRINKIVFSPYRARFGEEILSQAIFILYEKIKTYNLRYKDKKGNPRPVRFGSNNISISMDGRGRCLDNIFVERLWRTVKYENVYLKGYQTILEARSGLTEHFEFYNKERFHQSLDNKTPWAVYSGLPGVATESARTAVCQDMSPVKHII